jgi:hypothetical protein
MVLFTKEILKPREHSCLTLTDDIYLGVEVEEQRNASANGQWYLIWQLYIFQEGRRHRGARLERSCGGKGEKEVQDFTRRAGREDGATSILHKA